MLMRHIATVNGVEVHANKRMREVRNVIVTFSDGSWVNVATGEKKLKRRCAVQLYGQYKSSGGNSVTISNVKGTGNIIADTREPRPPMPPVPLLSVTPPRKPLMPVRPTRPVRPIRPLRPRRPRKPLLSGRGWWVTWEWRPRRR